MVAKVLGPKSLDEIFPKETTKQNKTKEGGIWEEEALEECTNVARKKTHTHTHTTQLKDQSKVAQLIQLELGC
jgi:hypothetical protein